MNPEILGNPEILEIRNSKTRNYCRKGFNYGLIGFKITGKVANKIKFIGKMVNKMKGIVKWSIK